MNEAIEICLVRLEYTERLQLAQSNSVGFKIS